MTAPAVTPLPADLAEALRARLRGGVVVMGIGNPLRGDDAVGSVVARALRGGLSPASGSVPPVTVLDAEEIPESWVGPAVAAGPDVVLLIDAVELGAAPGSAALLEAAELGRDACFTHRTPLGPVADYLERATGAEVLLLGIQPGPVRWGEELSPELRATVAGLVPILTAVLGARPAQAGTEAMAC